MKRFILVAFCLSLLFSARAAAADKNPVVVLDTTMGMIKIELYPDKAPATVKNFLAYVDSKFYDNTIFHRVVPNFVAQGGGMEPGMKPKETRAAIKNESDNGLSNERGTVAMARTRAPDSATSQFYINLKNNDFLDRAKFPDKVGYCVFGKVIDGMDVVDKIGSVPTNPDTAVPTKDVIIKSARVEKK